MLDRLEDLQQLTADVLVVGSGGAGCRAAISAHDTGAQVVVATASGLTGSSSTFYRRTLHQGYAFGANATEVEQHYENILEAGQGMVDPALARILAEEAPLRLQDLLEWGFPFETIGGQLNRIRPDFQSLSLEVAVAAARIDPGDMSRGFIRLIRERGIKELSHHFLICLLHTDGCCAGGLFLDRHGRPVEVRAKATVLATGGPNNVFVRYKNPASLEGVGHFEALLLGAELFNIEFYQVTFMMVGPIPGMNFSPEFFKAVPRMTNGLGEEFLPRYLPGNGSPEQCILERAQNGPFHSRGIAKYLDIAVVSEGGAGKGSPKGGVWVDFTHVPREELRDKDPANFDWLLAAGVDSSREPVEILTVPHAFNGGVRINPHMETSVPGLFACGEVAGGPHGANRIGGNSIAGTQVFGARAGRFAARWAKGITVWPPVKQGRIRTQLHRLRKRVENRTGEDPATVQHALQQAMWDGMVVCKDAVSLDRLLKILCEIKRDLLPTMTAATPKELWMAAGLPAQLTISEAIARVALARAESRGPHYRRDYPEPDDERFGRPIAVSRSRGELHLECRDV
jgi:succinate dehydrogenase/fumarate reductase flavoprotein subunit